MEVKSELFNEMNYTDREIFNLIHQYWPDMQKAIGQDLYAVIGNMGAGKSTTVNYMCGAEYDIVGRGFNQQLQLKNGYQEVTPSSDGSVAMTFIPKVCAKDELEDMFLDCPGFEGNRSEAKTAIESLATEVSFRASAIKGVIVIINYKDIDGGRGASFTNLLNKLSKLFILDQLQDSLYFIMTKSEDFYWSLSREELNKELVLFLDNQIKNYTQLLNMKKNESAQYCQGPQNNVNNLLGRNADPIYIKQLQEEIKGYKAGLRIMRLMLRSVDRISLYDPRTSLHREEIKNNLVNLQPAPLESFDFRGYASIRETINTTMNKFLGNANRFLDSLLDAPLLVRGKEADKQRKQQEIERLEKFLTDFAEGRIEQAEFDKEDQKAEKQKQNELYYWQRLSTEGKEYSVRVIPFGVTVCNDLSVSTVVLEMDRENKIKSARVANSVISLDATQLQSIQDAYTRDIKTIDATRSYSATRSRHERFVDDVTYFCGLTAENFGYKKNIAQSAYDNLNKDDVTAFKENIFRTIDTSGSLPWYRWWGWEREVFTYDCSQLDAKMGMDKLVLITEKEHGSFSAEKVEGRKKTITFDSDTGYYGYAKVSAKIPKKFHPDNVVTMSDLKKNIESYDTKIKDVENKINEKTTEIAAICRVREAYRQGQTELVKKETSGQISRLQTEKNQLDLEINDVNIQHLALQTAFKRDLFLLEAIRQLLDYVKFPENYSELIEKFKKLLNKASLREAPKLTKVSEEKSKSQADDEKTSADKETVPNVKVVLNLPQQSLSYQIIDDAQMSEILKDPMQIEQAMELLGRDQAAIKSVLNRITASLASLEARYEMFKNTPSPSNPTMKLSATQEDLEEELKKSHSAASPSQQGLFAEDRRKKSGAASVSSVPTL